MMYRSTWIPWVSVFLVACTGAVEGGMEHSPGGSGRSGGSNGETASDGVSDDARFPSVPPEIAAQCVGAPAVGPAPLRRLTAVEYRNTVRDLFPGVAIPELSLTVDNVVTGFDNNATAQSVSALLVEQYDTAAAWVAERAVAELDAWAPCDLSENQRECLTQIAREVGRQAFRRPLDAGEATRIERFARDNADDFGAHAALRMVVQAVLASPSFLYRPELGVAAADGDRSLTGHELASRLSYFLWRTMPDEALFEAAEQGALDTDEGLLAEVERMLSDPRARQTVSDFHSQWMELQRLDGLDLDSEVFPGVQEARADLKQSAVRFLDHHFWEGDVETLFTSNESFLNDRLAAFLGLPAPGSDELVPVPLDPGQRAGVLTQPGLMASTSHGLTHSPIMRGVTILRNVLCTDMPAPPPEVTPAIPDPVEGGAVTTRARVEQSHGTSECAGCHDLIDPVGFTFENYDAVGRYQVTEHGEPVDATGVVTRAGDVDGSYANGVELSQRFAESRQVRQCIATQWFRYGLGRMERGVDACQLQALSQQLFEDGDMRALLVVLATSPAFRRLPGDQS